MGAVGVHRHILEGGAALDQNVVFRQVLRLGEDHEAAPLQGLLGIGGQSAALGVGVVHGHGGGLHPAVVHEGDFADAAAVQAHGQGIGNGLGKLIILRGNGGVGQNLMVPFPKGLHGVGGDGFAPLVHVMNGHIHRLHQPLVGKGDFGGVGPVHIHDHGHGALGGERVLILGNQVLRPHLADAGLHGNEGIGRDGRARFIHIMQRHHGGLGHPLIGEGNLRGGRAFGGDIHFIRGRPGDEVFIRRDGRGGIHNVGAGLGDKRRVLGQGRAVFIHVVQRNFHRQHLELIQEGDFAGHSAVQRHVHGQGIRPVQGVAVNGFGIQGMGAALQGELGVGQKGSAVFVHIVHRHSGRRHIAGIGKGDFAGRSAVFIHGDQNGGAARSGILVNIGGADGMFARVKGINHIVKQRQAVFIHIVHRHVGGGNQAGIHKGHFIGQGPGGVHDDLIFLHALQGVALQRRGADGGSALLEGKHLVRHQGDTVYIRVMHRHIGGNLGPEIGKGDIAGESAGGVHGNGKSAGAEQLIAGNLLRGNGVHALLQGEHPVLQQHLAVFIGIMHRHLSGLGRGVLQGRVRQIQVINALVFPIGVKSVNFHGHSVQAAHSVLNIRKGFPLAGHKAAQAAGQVADIQGQAVQRRV